MNESSEPPRRLLLIANPISGGGRGRSLAPRLVAALARRGIAGECHLTTSGGDAAERARRAGAEAWDGLVVLGGDGTVNQVLNGMPDPSRPIGVLPVGTANVLAMELRLPRKVEAAADVLAAGHRRRLALGRCNGRRFLLFAGAGVDGAIVRRLEQVRTGTLGKHKWFGPLWHTVRNWPQFDLAVRFADGERWHGLQSVLVTTVRNYGGVFRLPPEVDATHGDLHVLGFRMRTRAAWLWHGLRGALGGLRVGPDLLLRRARRLTIEGAAPFQIDGDFGGDTPAEFDLLPEPAQVFAPRVG